MAHYSDMGFDDPLSVSQLDVWSPLDARTSLYTKPFAPSLCCALVPTVDSSKPLQC